MTNPRKLNPLAADSTLSMSLNTLKPLCHMGVKCVRKCTIEKKTAGTWSPWPEHAKERPGYFTCHGGLCWPTD